VFGLNIDSIVSITLLSTATPINDALIWSVCALPRLVTTQIIGEARRSALFRATRRLLGPSRRQGYTEQDAGRKPADTDVFNVGTSLSSAGSTAS